MQLYNWNRTQRRSAGSLREAFRVSTKRLPKFDPVLLAILGLATSLRVPAIMAGLPDYPGFDEPVMTSIATKIFRGDLNPHFHYYGSFYFYVSAVLVAITHTVHYGLAALHLTAVSYTPYWLFILAGRVLNLGCALIMITLTYYIGNQSFGRKAANLSAVVLAVMPFHVSLSLTVAPNILAATCLLAATAAALRFALSEKPAWLFASSVAAGLALSSKYLFAAPLAPLLAAYVVNRGHRRTLAKKMFLSLAITSVVFLVTSPYLLLDMQTALQHVLFDNSHYSVGHPGMDSDNAFAFYMRYLITDGATAIVFVLAIIGLTMASAQKPAAMAIIAIAPVAWLLISSSYHVTFVHNILSMAPLIALGAGYALSRLLVTPLTAALFPIALALPLAGDFAWLDRQLKPDVREEVRNWAQTRIPCQARVAREEYTPYVDNTETPSRYLGICSLARYRPEQLGLENYDYVLAAGYERFFANPERYAQNLLLLKDNVDNLALVKQFVPRADQRGSTITVFSPKTPSQ